MTELPDRLGGGPGPAGEPLLPDGDVYDWYSAGRAAHASGDHDRAVELLSWVAAAEPGARSVREALARAQFDGRRFTDAAATFGSIAAEDPADDYAQFGLGLSAMRAGDLEAALNHLALAAALHPGVRHYDQALREARATRRARRGDDPSGGS